jgi:hypothetical protein
VIRVNLGNTLGLSHLDSDLLGSGSLGKIAVECSQREMSVSAGQFQHPAIVPRNQPNQNIRVNGAHDVFERSAGRRLSIQHWYAPSEPWRTVPDGLRGELGMRYRHNRYYPSNGNGGAKRFPG